MAEICSVCGSWWPLHPPRPEAGLGAVIADWGIWDLEPRLLSTPPCPTSAVCSPPQVYPEPGRSQISEHLNPDLLLPCVALKPLNFDVSS